MGGVHVITGVWVSADRTRLVIQRDTHRSVIGIDTSDNDAKTHEPELAVIAGAYSLGDLNWIELVPETGEQL